MKKLSAGCVIMGIVSIILSISAIPSGYLSLPFQLLIESLRCAAVAVPKFTFFVNIFRMAFFDYFFSIILIISGTGTILVKRWGRTFAYIYARGITFLSIIGLFVALPGYIVMYNKMIKQGSLALLPIYFGGGGYLLTLLGALFYPIILLIFFSWPKIKEKFAVRK